MSSTKICKNIGSRCYFFAVITFLNYIEDKIIHKKGLEDVFSFVKEFCKKHQIEDIEACPLIKNIIEQYNKIKGYGSLQYKIEEVGYADTLLNLFLKQSSYYNDDKNNICYLNLRKYKITKSFITNNEANFYSNEFNDTMKKIKNLKDILDQDLKLLGGLIQILYKPPKISHFVSFIIDNDILTYVDPNYDKKEIKIDLNKIDNPIYYNSISNKNDFVISEINYLIMNKNFDPSNYEKDCITNSEPSLQQYSIPVIPSKNKFIPILGPIEYYILNTIIQQHRKVTYKPKGCILKFYGWKNHIIFKYDNNENNLKICFRKYYVNVCSKNFKLIYDNNVFKEKTSDIEKKQYLDKNLKQLKKYINFRNIESFEYIY